MTFREWEREHWKLTAAISFIIALTLAAAITAAALIIFFPPALPFFVGLTAFGFTPFAAFAGSLLAPLVAAGAAAAVAFSFGTAFSLFVNGMTHIMNFGDKLHKKPVPFLNSLSEPNLGQSSQNPLSEPNLGQDNRNPDQLGGVAPILKDNPPKIDPPKDDSVKRELPNTEPPALKVQRRNSFSAGEKFTGTRPLFLGKQAAPAQQLADVEPETRVPGQGCA